MKRLLTTLILLSAIPSYAQVVKGTDQNGEDCSLEIISTDDETMIVKVRGKKLKKRKTIQFDEKKNKFVWEKDWQLTSNDMSPGFYKFLHVYPDFNDKSGKSFKSFIYSQGGIFHRKINVNCKL